MIEDKFTPPPHHIPERPYDVRESLDLERGDNLFTFLKSIVGAICSLGIVALFFLFIIAVIIGGGAFVLTVAVVALPAFLIFVIYAKIQ